MKVTFIGINSSYVHTNLAVYYLYANSVPEGVEAGIKQYNINMFTDEVIEDLYNEHSSIYFFSSYIWNIEYNLKVASSLKKLTGAKIVFGGSEVSYNAKKYFKDYDFIDFVIAGEGEKVTYELLNAINTSSGISIKNVFTKRSVDYTYQKEILDFSKIKFPYENISPSELNGKIVYYESARGCPFSCSYCISHIERQIRYRDTEQVKQELLYFISNNIPLVKFVDRTFNSNIKRAKEIVRFILDNIRNTRFHFEICADLLDDELISLFNEAPKDLFQLEIGLQSINKRTLTEISRSNNLDKISENIEKLMEKDNIHIHLDLIAGLPYEDFGSFLESFDYAYNRKADMLQVGFLKVLHGTEMERNAERYGLKYAQFPPYEIFENKWLSFEDLRTIKEIEKLVDRYYNSGSFKLTLKYSIEEKGILPSEFYLNLLSFFESNKLNKKSHAKDDYYQLIYEFLLTQIQSEEDKLTVKTLLSFDYIMNIRRRLPAKEFTDGIRYLNKEEVFRLLKEDGFTERYVPDFLDVPLKEIYKNIIIYEFDINPESCKKMPVKVLFFTREDRYIII